MLLTGLWWGNFLPLRCPKNRTCPLILLATKANYSCVMWWLSVCEGYENQHVHSHELFRWDLNDLPHFELVHYPLRYVRAVIRQFKLLVYSKRQSQVEILVQAFYRQKTVNLPLIAKEGFLTVFGPGTCPLQHIKSPRKSELGKLTKNEFF